MGDLSALHWTAQLSFVCALLAGLLLFMARFIRDWLCDRFTARLVSYTGLVSAFASFWAFFAARLYA